MKVNQNRRLVAILVASLLVIVIAAGCGSGDSDNASEGPTSEGQPKAGGVLRFAWEDEPTTLDPIVPSDNWAIWTITNVFEQLVRVNADGSGLEPGLAESWEVSDDGLTYTFELRPGAKFSDGVDVSAEDVVFSLDRVRGEDSNWASLFAAIESVEATGPSTVAVTTTQPSAVLLSQLALFSASIVPKSAVTADPTGFGEKPVGSGPFMVADWQRGVSLKLEKNPYYSKEEGKPYLDGAEFFRVPEDNSRVLQLQSNEIDVARPISFANIGQFASDPQYQVPTSPLLRSDVVLLNNAEPPFDDKLVRQAVNYAVDKQAIIDAVFFGHGSVANTYLPMLPGWWDESVPAYDYDVEKAKELLAASSHPDGFETTILFTGTPASNEKAALIIQQNLAELGITVKLQALDFGAEWSKLQEGDFAMCKEWVSSDILDPDQMTTFAVVVDDRAMSYWTRYDNPDVGRWAREAQVELDEAKRRDLYNKIQATVTEDAPFIFCYYLPDDAVFRSNVKGFKVLPTGNYRLEDVWLDQ